MSNWTHVAAIARIDRQTADEYEGNYIPDFDKIFGKEIGYDDWNDYCKNPELYLPAGSEGSLRKSVWINPEKYFAAGYTVSIFGDLRDHDDPAAIVEWFKEKLKDLWVRDAVIIVRNELNGTVRWNYDWNEDLNKI